MKKRIAGMLLVVVLGAAAYWGYFSYTGGAKASALQATGTIEATQVELRAKLSGTLQKLSVNSGDQVKKDQVVGQIYRSDLIVQKERDALGVLKARAQLADLVSGAREQEIKEAEIAVSTAQINYDRAGEDYNRAMALFQEKAISESEMEKAEAALKQSLNQLESAKARLSLLLAGSRPEQVEAARAELERSIAVLKASEAMLEDTKIICPIDGTVLTRNFEEGEYVQAGASVATVANLNDMWIKVYIPTDDLPKIRLGQQVRFTVSGSPAVYTGIIEEIASRGEFTPKTIQTKKERANIVYAVKIRVNNEGGVLKPGMPADVTME
ncbi:membrane-fusion protein [Pelotomaculum thermopropionicum SI]|uniref:Membrane-fusion protein n=1 Tax=Pelotomaculum thermopropionicum (strain DSM 13744 / JCM 10971 / SI) TaxID=370438 RepID=A5D233_PELTS|nr:membrane-fusion protein [Pelotomaculum thermopropionicum SI]